MTAPGSRGSVGRRLAIVAGVVVLATIVASVIVTGTPSEQREIRLDTRRVDDLRNLEAEIQRHVKQEGALPASLVSLADRPGTRLAIVDPVSGNPYEFEPTGARAYRLCATFTTDTALAPPPTSYSPRDTDWAHGIGRHCFDRTATQSGNN